MLGAVATNKIDLGRFLGEVDGQTLGLPLPPRWSRSRLTWTTWGTSAPGWHPSAPSKVGPRETKHTCKHQLSRQEPSPSPPLPSPFIQLITHLCHVYAYLSACIANPAPPKPKRPWLNYTQQ